MKKFTEEHLDSIEELNRSEVSQILFNQYEAGQLEHLNNMRLESRLIAEIYRDWCKNNIFEKKSLEEISNELTSLFNSMLTFIEFVNVKHNNNRCEIEVGYTLEAEEKPMIVDCHFEYHQ